MRALLLALVLLAAGCGNDAGDDEHRQDAAAETEPAALELVPGAPCTSVGGATSCNLYRVEAGHGECTRGAMRCEADLRWGTCVVPPDPGLVSTGGEVVSTHDPCDPWTVNVVLSPDDLAALAGSAFTVIDGALIVPPTPTPPAELSFETAGYSAPPGSYWTTLQVDCETPGDSRVGIFNGYYPSSVSITNAAAADGWRSFDFLGPNPLKPLLALRASSAGEWPRLRGVRLVGHATYE
jgi:hypothetical protein